MGLGGESSVMGRCLEPPWIPPAELARRKNPGCSFLEPASAEPRLPRKLENVSTSSDSAFCEVPTTPAPAHQSTAHEADDAEASPMNALAIRWSCVRAARGS